jgi:hypothetical protein
MRDQRQQVGVRARDHNGSGLQKRARGYRTTRNLKAIVYLAAGKLDFNPAT